MGDWPIPDGIFRLVIPARGERLVRYSRTREAPHVRDHLQTGIPDSTLGARFHPATHVLELGYRCQHPGVLGGNDESNGAYPHSLWLLWC